MSSIRPSRAVQAYSPHSSRLCTVEGTDNIGDIPMSDNPVSLILSAIERLRGELLVRLTRLEALLENHDQMGPASIGDSEVIPAEIFAHVQNRGDVEGNLSDWIGERRSGLSVEGFSITPRQDISPDELLYRVVLEQNRLSPWTPSGQYCGSMGLAMPLRGFCVALSGVAASNFECRYSATFVDGSLSDVRANGQICAAATLAPLEAFQITLRRRS